MTQGLITEQYVKDIAEAIRFKNNENRSYCPSEMAEAIMNIPTGGGGLDLVTSLSLDVNETVTYDKNVIATATLMADYDDLTPADIDLKGYLKNATVLFYDSNNNLLGTAITNVDGIAICNLVLNETTTIHCVFNGTSDYNSCISNSISIEVIPSLFYDKCNNDNKLNHYETYNLLSVDGRAILTYNSNENAYELKPVTDTRDNWIGFTIDDMKDVDNYRCEIKFKAKLPTTNHAYNQLLIGVVDYDISNYYGCRVRSDNLYQMFLLDFGNEYEQTIYTNNNRFANQYYKLVIEKDDIGIVYTLFDNNDNELGKFQQEIFLLNSFGFFMGVQMRNNGSDTRNFGFYIKDIIFTELM